MNPAALKSISAKLVSKLATSDAAGTGKTAAPFWLFLGKARRIASGLAPSDGKKALLHGSSHVLGHFAKFTTGGAEGTYQTVGPFFLFSDKAEGVTSGLSQSDQKRGSSLSNMKVLSPMAKFALVLRQLGLPLNSLRLPSDALPHLRSLLVSQGMSLEQVESLLKRCTSEDGAIEVDKLVVPFLGDSHLRGSAKDHKIIRAEDRTELETLLSELQLAPEEIRELVAGAVTSRGDLNVEWLVEGLKQAKPKLAVGTFVEICHRRGIKLRSQALKIERHHGQKPPAPGKPGVDAASSATKPNSQADSGVTPASTAAGFPELSPVSEHSERLEMASRLRHEGAPPEQVQRLLEKLTGNARHVQEMHAEVKGQNPESDPDIQALLARLQHRTGNDQIRNGRWSRQGKITSEPLMRVGSDATIGPAERDPVAAEAAKSAATLIESKQTLEEEMATELRGNWLRTAAGTEQRTKAAQRKRTISGAVASLTAEGTAGTKGQAVSSSTSAGSQPPTPTVEPQIQVAQRFVIMSENGESHTKLTLHPPELGRIQIEISLESNKLSATLVTETQVVKELLETHLGQLRQHLAQHDLRLENFHVTVDTDASPYKESKHESLGSGKRSQQAEAAEPPAMNVEGLGATNGSDQLDSGNRIDLFA